MDCSGPYISLVIPAYNHATSLARCLDSLLVQRDVRIEIIIVDDGSTDDTQAVVRPYVARGVARLITQANAGAAAARNRGAREARGTFVMFVDADASMPPDTLARLHHALCTHPRAAYAYGDFRYGWKRFRAGEFDARRLRQRNDIHTGALIRLERFPGFDESLKRFQDWDLWLTMAERGDEGVKAKGVCTEFSLERPGMSSWLPKQWYRAPWRWIPGIRRRVLAYERARAILYKKHGIL